MGKKLDLTRKIFGRLMALDECGNRFSYVLWRCICDCGNIVEVTTSNLTTGRTKSCGCLHKEVLTNINKKIHNKHGHRKKNKTSNVYNSWRSMKTRCYNTNYDSYSRYGGRGIYVCRRWRISFKNFLKDMGERPNGTTLDRINNDGPYGPWNCKWSTSKEQVRNSSSRKLIISEVRKIKQLLQENIFTVKDISKLLDVTEAQIYSIKNKKTWIDII